MTSVETWISKAFREILDVETNRLLCAFLAGVLFTLGVVLLTNSKPSVKHRGKRPVVLDSERSNQVVTANLNLDFATLLQKLALEHLQRARESRGIEVGAESEDEVQMALATRTSGGQHY
ncbi:hypothetical protein BT96DRAFT_1006611 [Gymnopus androsaceus JB14]|uniref:Uncharacterized protein n=1 Tax=Gymnopus androsaceus JB14 TaxID=1447944 RepID=A0A6A4GKH8_9AGAR|nr:hypothetical protein BT96DRAFT_1006611 [Gymnopus androsaceus JB14]